ncbi:hypothetical protein JTE90_017209, partial [Oedothorax gibbosus]
GDLKIVSQSVGELPTTSSEFGSFLAPPGKVSKSFKNFNRSSADKALQGISVLVHVKGGLSCDEATPKEGLQLIPLENCPFRWIRKVGECGNAWKFPFWRRLTFSFGGWQELCSRVSLDDPHVLLGVSFPRMLGGFLDQSPAFDSPDSSIRLR